MDEFYGLHPTTNDYADKALMSPDNLMLSAEYQSFISSSSSAAGDHYRTPMFGSDHLISAVSAVSEVRGGDEDCDDDMSSTIKAKIASHPYYPKLLEAYIECQKVGAPPEISCLLDEIQRDNNLYRLGSVSSCLGADPELDEFMETFCDILVNYKSDLSRHFDEASTFLNKIQIQLRNLCTDEVAVSSDEEFSGEMEIQEARMRSEEQELKDALLRKYGSHIGSLKLDFSKKKKKKEKLPKDARQTLFDWWSSHYKWPYPTEADKIFLAESTGLDQKQITNWFINQRKRHWKPTENMMENLSGHFFTDDH